MWPFGTFDHGPKESQRCVYRITYLYIYIPSIFPLLLVKSHHWGLTYDQMIGFSQKIAAVRVDFGVSHFRKSYQIGCVYIYIWYMIYIYICTPWWYFPWYIPLFPLGTPHRSISWGEADGRDPSPQRLFDRHFRRHLAKPPMPLPKGRG